MRADGVAYVIENKSLKRLDWLAVLETMMNDGGDPTDCSGFVQSRDSV